MNKKIDQMSFLLEQNIIYLPNDVKKYDVRNKFESSNDCKWTQYDLIPKSDNIRRNVLSLQETPLGFILRMPSNLNVLMVFLNGSSQMT